MKREVDSFASSKPKKIFPQKLHTVGVSRIVKDLIHPTKNGTILFIFLDFTATITLNFWAKIHSL